MMRPSLRLFSLLLCLSLTGLTGCQEMSLFRFQSPDEEPEEDALLRVEREERAAGKRSLVKDYTTISGNKVVVVEGVGLVTGLDGTGGDSPATNHRKELLDEMRRMHIENPNEVLRSPYTALVVVRGFLPALLEKGETFDVEVRLPDGSEATSLAGGYLMKCDLWEKQMVPGRGVMSGHRLARAEGPILISADVESAKPGDAGLMRGTIPAGAVCLREDKPLTIHVRSDYRSWRMADRIAKRIGERFHDYDEHGLRRPLAKFGTDARIDLEIHPRYKNNDPRYLEVVRHIAFNETKVERRLRMQRLQQELMNGPTAEQAALQLEAIGNEAVPILKEGLKAPSLESRFHSAMALAYLGIDEGMDVLAEAASQERAFRVHAFAAMTALDGGEAYQPLIDLLQHPSIETRYGAFRTLTTLNPNDPSVRGEDMQGQFTMHVVSSDQDPLIHVTRRQKTELVLFGKDQKFRTPLAINAGKYIWVTSRRGQDYVVVSRHEQGKPSRRLEIPPYIDEVIRTVVGLGATYPDVVQMLMQAERQHNLPGRIAIDALPQPGRVYQRPPAEQASGGRSTRVGHVNMIPNLFAPIDEEPSEDAEAPSPETTEIEEPQPQPAATEPPAAEAEAQGPNSEAAAVEEPGVRRSRLKSVFSAITAYDE